MFMFSPILVHLTSSNTISVCYFGAYLHVSFDHGSNTQSAVGLEQTCRPLVEEYGSMTAAVIYELFGIEPSMLSSPTDRYVDRRRRLQSCLEAPQQRTQSPDVAQWMLDSTLSQPTSTLRHHVAMQQCIPSCLRAITVSSFSRFPM